MREEASAAPRMRKRAHGAHGTFHYGCGGLLGLARRHLAVFFSEERTDSAFPHPPLPIISRSLKQIVSVPPVWSGKRVLQKWGNQKKTPLSQHPFLKKTFSTKCSRVAVFPRTLSRWCTTVGTVQMAMLRASLKLNDLTLRWDTWARYRQHQKRFQVRASFTPTHSPLC